MHFFKKHLFYTAAGCLKSKELAVPELKKPAVTIQI
jgi:hypothetical protein